MYSTTFDFDTVHDRRNTASLKWDCAEEIYNRKDVLPMWIADMDFTAPSSVTDAIKRRNEHGIFGYMECLPLSYCEAIADWVERRHQWRICREWLKYTPGVVPALSAAVITFTRPGDSIIIQTPVYPPFYTVIRENGRQIAENPLKLIDGRYYMDFENLEQHIESGAKMLILCSPHNPTGRVWTREELTRLGEMCTRNGVIIVSDEIHSDIVFKGHKHIPIASISDEIAGNSVTCTAASKTFGIAGLVSSTTIIPNNTLRAEFGKKTQCLGIDTGNVFGITASEAAYRYGGEWLEQLIEYVSGNLALLEEYFRDNIPLIKPIKPDGTYLVWLDCREMGLDAQELSEFMVCKAGIGLNSGLTFGLTGSGFMRMNIACPRSTLIEGLRRIEEAVRCK